MIKDIFYLAAGDAHSNKYRLTKAPIDVAKFYSLPTVFSGRRNREWEGRREEEREDWGGGLRIWMEPYEAINRLTFVFKFTRKEKKRREGRGGGRGKRGGEEGGKGGIKEKSCR